MTTPNQERNYWDAATSDAEYRIWNDRDPDQWAKDADKCTSYIKDQLSECWSPDAKWLDLGCGMGRITHRLAVQDNAPFIIGVDLSTSMVALANKEKRANESFLANNGRDIEAIRSDTIDAVYSMITFQHIPTEGFMGYLYEIARVLKPDGRFCFQYVEGNSQRSLRHEAPTESVEKFCKEVGLEVTSIDTGFMKPQWTWISGYRI